MFYPLTQSLTNEFYWRIIVFNQKLVKPCAWTKNDLYDRTKIFNYLWFVKNSSCSKIEVSSTFFNKGHLFRRQKVLSGHLVRKKTTLKKQESCVVFILKMSKRDTLRQSSKDTVFPFYIV